MLSPKSRQQQSEENTPPQPLGFNPKWKLGVDRRQVAVYVSIAIIAGFLFGFGTAKYLTVDNAKPERARIAAEQRSLTPEPAPSSVSVPESSTFHKVNRIIRADTIEVDGVGMVRMIGIDSPDGKPQYGQHGIDARSFTEKAVLGKDVKLEFDLAYAARSNKDDAGQTMAYVIARDGTNVNGEIIRQGHAFVRVAEPFKRIDDFRSLELEAMQTMRGLWGLASSSTAASATAAASDRRRISPLSPAELGPNVPAVSGTGSSTDVTVYFAPGEKIYHKSECELLGKKKQAMPLSTARSQGFSSCGRCFASTVLRAP